MGSKTRKRTRDVPHPSKRPGEFPSLRKRRKAMSQRIRESMTPAVDEAKANTAPSRPQISMLVEDLAEGLEPAPIFGQYPVGLIEKLLPRLGVDRTRILHVCSGALRRGEGIRVDLRPDARPDILADGRALPFADGTIDAILIDPPYTEQYARDLYGVDYPLPSHLLREAARVAKPNAVIGFVHYLVPMPPDGCRHLKTHGLSMGFGFPMRAVTMFVRDQASLPGVR